MWVSCERVVRRWEAMPSFRARIPVAVVLDLFGLVVPVGSVVRSGGGGALAAAVRTVVASLEQCIGVVLKESASGHCTRLELVPQPPCRLFPRWRLRPTARRPSAGTVRLRCLSLQGSPLVVVGRGLRG